MISYQWIFDLYTYFMYLYSWDCETFSGEGAASGNDRSLVQLLPSGANRKLSKLSLL